MENTQRISWTQLAGLIIATNLTGTLTNAYIVKGQPFGDESWLVPLIAGPLGILIGLLAYNLAVRFPRETIFQYSKKILGKPLGWIINLMIVLLLIDWGGISIRQFTEFYVSVQYVDTPQFVFTVILALLSVHIVRAGVEVLGRQGVIWAILVMIASFIIHFGTFNRWEITEVPAPWDVNLIDLIIQSYMPIGVFGEISWIIFIVIPYLNNYRHGPRAIIFSTIVSSLMVCLSAVALIAVLGEELIILNLFPTFEVATAISFGEIFERIEYIVTLFWIGSMVVKVSILLLGAALGFQDLFQIKQRNHAISIVVILMIVWSYLVFGNIYDMEEFLRPAGWLTHALPLQIGIPGLLILVALIRQVRGEQNGVSH